MLLIPSLLLVRPMVFGVIVALVLSSPAYARSYYVAPDGNDSNDGSAANHFLTIHHAAGLAMAGDVIEVAPGEYRNESIVFSHSGQQGRPITLRAASGANVLVKGSLPVSGWKKTSDGIYVAKNWSFYFGAYSASAGDARGMARNQVFVGGVIQEEVSALNKIKPGCFYLDPETKAIYLQTIDGGDPNNRPVEVTATAGPLLDTNGQNFIVIEGIKFCHCANEPQEKAMVRLSGGSNCLVKDCQAQWASGAGITVTGTDQLLQSSQFNNNGQLGIHSSKSVRLRVEHCETSRNNLHPGKTFNPAWEAGGNKFSRSQGCVVDGHRADDNHGPGIWFDVDNENATIINSLCTRNMIGIQYEISYTALIANNVCVNQALHKGDITGPPVLQGIYISSSAGCKVFNNTCYGNPKGGIDVSGPVRGDGAGRPVYSYANLIYNNIVAENQKIGNSKSFAVPVADSPDPKLVNPYVPFAPNISDYNLFYYSGKGAFFIAPNSRPTTLAEWQRDTGEDRHSRWGDPAFVNPGQGDFTLKSQSPAINCGKVLDEIVRDAAGRPRLGVVRDAGAFEYTHAPSPP
ncbi:MAG: right-handed parallel beta-helix repeat-containing protein [Chthoniobacteraceae bacterium]